MEHENSSLFSSKLVWLCIAIGFVVLIAVTIWKIPVGTVFFAGMLLACPLLHLWMMKNGGHKH